MEPFIGTILAFGFNFPPKGWMVCAGAILPIPQYTALFSLLGNVYGGDGKSTFGLPNLCGRTAIGFGPNNEIGQNGGATTHSMTTLEMPSHTHVTTTNISLPVVADTADVPTPTNNVLGYASGVNVYSNQPADVALAPFTATGQLLPIGNGSAVSTISPYLVLNYSIALVGIFPSRN
jgi:microcystin-dependent protein